MSMKAVFVIGRQEFVRVLTYPLVLVAVLVVLIIAFLNGAGDVSNLRASVGTSGADAVILGFTEIWQSTSMICTIMAVFLGATMIAYERWNNSVNVLLTKPLYRRDYYIGKFLGLSAFMLIFNTFTLLLVGFMIILFIGEPQSVLDFLSRVTAYILVMTLVCWVVIALNMLFGTISKNILFVTAASMTYVFFDWIWYNDRILGSLSTLTPMNIYNEIINSIQTSAFPTLFDTLVPFNQWFEAAIPDLALLIIEMSILLLAGIYIFSKIDCV